MLPFEALRIAVRVARAEVHQAQLRIDGRGAPNGTTAGPPHLVVWPRLVPGFAWSRDGIKPPHLGAGSCVEGTESTPPPTIAPRDRHEHDSAGIARCGRNDRRSSVGGVRRERVRPPTFPGPHIDGRSRSTGARHKHKAEIGTNNHPASGRRLCELEYPHNLARLRVQRSHFAVQRRHEEQPVRHRDRCLVRQARKLGHPRATERCDIARGDLRQR